MNWNHLLTQQYNSNHRQLTVFQNMLISACRCVYLQNQTFWPQNIHFTMMIQERRLWPNFWLSKVLGGESRVDKEIGRWDQRGIRTETDGQPGYYHNYHTQCQGPSIHRSATCESCVFTHNHTPVSVPLEVCCCWWLLQSTHPFTCHI